MPPAVAPPSLAAYARASEVEMEVVGMRGVVVWTEHRVEEPAGRVPRGGEESPFGAFGTPVPQHRNARPVGQPEAGDVDGVGGRVLAAPPGFRRPDIAAGIGAEMVDARQREAEMRPGKLLQPLLV